MANIVINIVTNKKSNVTKSLNRDLRIAIHDKRLYISGMEKIISDPGDEVEYITTETTRDEGGELVSA